MAVGRYAPVAQPGLLSRLSPRFDIPLSHLECLRANRLYRIRRGKPDNEQRRRNVKCVSFILEEQRVSNVAYE